MSTRSYIAKQIADNKFRTIYCHSDGYLTHNGALLLDHYSEADKLDELLNLGDISCLEPTINPDPTKPHSFNYDERQEGVVIAYGRDRGDKDVDAKTFTAKELTSDASWVAYIYILDKDNKWIYGRPGDSISEFRSVEEGLEKTYSYYDMERPEGYYGVLTDDVAEELKAQQDSTESNVSVQTM